MSKKEDYKINSKELSNWNTKALDFKLTKWEDMPDIGLYMDQVLVLMDKYIGSLFIDKENFLTPSMINNYVKLGVMKAPVAKKYSREHLVFLTLICLMKQTLSISSIKYIIENELTKITITELYTKFCNYYEGYLIAILKGENILLENTSKDSILKLGIVSNICRLVSDIELKILEEKNNSLKNKKNEELKKEEPKKK